jgi:hypothetical protein
LAKQKRITSADPTDLGDQYVFIGIDATRKTIISYRVCKRDNANAFLADLRRRIVNRPEISSDGFSPCLEAVERSFGADCPYGQVIKQYHGEPAIDTTRRYSPGVVVGIRRHRRPTLSARRRKKPPPRALPRVQSRTSSDYTLSAPGGSPAQR